MKYTIVTTFNKECYDNYAHRFMESMAKYIPEDIKIVAYVEGMELQSDRIEIIDYNKVCGEKYKAFADVAIPLETAKMDTHEARAIGVYRWHATRFSHKYFACAHAIENATTRYVMWIDADVLADGNIPDGWFDQFVQEGKYWSNLHRPTVYPECGFMIWDTEHPIHEKYWKIMDAMYNGHQLFKIEEWHDSWVWWYAEKYIRQKLNEDIGFIIGDQSFRHPFVRSELGRYFDHCKGNRKETGMSPERAVVWGVKNGR